MFPGLGGYPEFISKAPDHWAYENDVTLNLSRPGKPTDIPYTGSFNGSFRDECLNLHRFLSLDDAREKIETWRREYCSTIILQWTSFGGVPQVHMQESQ